MKSRTLLIIIISVFPCLAGAQSFNDGIYHAYVVRDMNLWEQMLRDNRNRIKSPPEKYDFAMACYGFIGYCLGKDQEKRAQPFLETVDSLADCLLKTDPFKPEYLALRGAVYGFRLSCQKHKLLSLGPKASQAISMAMHMGSGCPQAWVEAGNRDWWMPEIFGGSRVNALTKFEKAIGLMEADPLLLKNNWYYLNINMMLAGYYEQSGMTVAAREIYRKMIRLEPEFHWAREREIH